MKYQWPRVTTNRKRISRCSNLFVRNFLFCVTFCSLLSTLSNGEEFKGGYLLNNRLAGRRAANRTAEVDDKGVLRWADNNEEVALFGVNYCVPSASAFRMIERIGASHYEAVDQDMVHFERMGLDAIRLSFWGDWECSDANGNLVENEHLRVLDYVIYKAKKHGIYMLFSPIVLYNAGWPDALGRPRAGLSSAYSKDKMCIDPNAIKAQTNYLRQIMEHVNSFTQIAYKDEPAILAVELVNEPHHYPEDYNQAVEYINTLYNAIAGTGCRKPVCSNVTQDMRMAKVIRDSKAEGATFGWYPTGLLTGRPLEGNFLVQVDDYPQMRDPCLANTAKLVYEFDAADVAGSYMYPAMARAFRVGGAQFAAMFTYDSLPIASTNAEFQTHYLNLAYTPNKAVSFIIAAEAFRRLPRLKSYGRYPQSARFGPFSVDYDRDLSEMVTDTEFMYSNDTETVFQDPAKLERLVGCGSSSLVKYEGTGCYFLEKLKPGLWRLEVYPDAVFVAEPYNRPSLKREISRIIWRRWPMTINLPDLGEAFTVESIKPSSGHRTSAKAGQFDVGPGVYLLRRKDAESDKKPKETPVLEGLVDYDFIAPPQYDGPIVVVHKQPYEIVANRTWTCRATVVSSEMPNEVGLYFRQAGQAKFVKCLMHRTSGYRYEVNVPADMVEGALIEYFISVCTTEGARTFPGRIQSEPERWDFPLIEGWETMVVNENTPLVIFDAKRDRNCLLFCHSWGGVKRKVDYVHGMTPSSLAMRISVPRLDYGPANVAIQHNFVGKLGLRSNNLEQFDTLVLRARSAGKNRGGCGVSLIEQDGMAWGTTVDLKSTWQEIRVPLDELHPVKAAMLPQGWPKSNPYWLRTPPGRGGKNDSLKLENVQGVQITIGKEHALDGARKGVIIEIEGISLERKRSGNGKEY